MATELLGIRVRKVRGDLQYIAYGRGPKGQRVTLGSAKVRVDADKEIRRATIQRLLNEVDGKQQGE